ncbi:MAG: hypothetical protein NXI12_03245 [Alphaproteobacteria bacterium]|nr:hypothetical protein [Alphaproteobacteria bacterium]
MAGAFAFARAGVLRAGAASACLDCDFAAVDLAGADVSASGLALSLFGVSSVAIACLSNLRPLFAAAANIAISGAEIKSFLCAAQKCRQAGELTALKPVRPECSRP